MADLENKLSDLEHDERQLQEETAEVRGRQRDEARRLGRERIEPFIKRAKEKVAEIKRKLAAVDRDQIPSLQQEDFDRAKKRVEQLGAALEQGDLEEVYETARSSADHVLPFVSSSVSFTPVTTRTVSHGRSSRGKRASRVCRRFAP